jgi:hypothetical protein
VARSCESVQVAEALGYEVQSAAPRVVTTKRTPRLTQQDDLDEAAGAETLLRAKAVALRQGRLQPPSVLELLNAGRQRVGAASDVSNDRTCDAVNDVDRIPAHEAWAAEGADLSSGPDVSMGVSVRPKMAIDLHDIEMEGLASLGMSRLSRQQLHRLLNNDDSSELT